MTLDEWFNTYVMVFGVAQLQEGFAEGELEFLEQVCRDMKVREPLAYWTNDFGEPMCGYAVSVFKAMAFQNGMGSKLWASDHNTHTQRG